MNPIFSVLIANYNNGHYLQEAINSVTEQTYPHWEVVIVDDGSIDNSESVYARYANDSRFRIYRNKKNMGCGFTKRRLVELSQGEICGFLDADDYLENDALEVMAEAHEKHPEVSIIMSRYRFCNDNWETLEENRLLTIADGESYFSTNDYTPEHFVSFKRNYYLQTEGINPMARLAEDRDLFFKLEEVGKLLVLDKFLYRYRASANSVSRGDSRYALFWDSIIKYEACKRRGLSPAEFAYPDFKYFIETHISLENTNSYRLGHTILQPFVWCKRLFIMLFVRKRK